MKVKNDYNDCNTGSSLSSSAKYIVSFSGEKVFNFIKVVIGGLHGPKFAGPALPEGNYIWPRTL